MELSYVMLTNPLISPTHKISRVAFNIITMIPFREIQRKWLQRLSTRLAWPFSSVIRIFIRPPPLLWDPKVRN